MSWFHPYAVGRRATVAGYLVWSALGLLTVAFFRVQVLGSSRYRLQSEENRLRPIPIPAARGLITDRNGQVLAENVPGYSVGLIASSIDSLRATLQRIAPLIGIDSAAAENASRRFRRRPFEPVIVKRDAPFELVSALEERRMQVPGLVIQTEPKRRYPYGPVTAHAVGYVGEVTERELSSAKFAGARAGTLVGRDGLERQYDDQLRGEDGVRFVEVTARGRAVSGSGGVGSELEPRQGASVRTSLDIDLQQYVASVFPGDGRGAVMVMDPATGELLALYSSPSYDPNTFIGGIDPAVWEALSRSDAHPLIDRAIQARYPPASPWKLAIATMAMRRGLVDLASRMPMPCRGGMQYGNRYFRCWKLDGHGDLTLAEAIQFSCDVYFYQLGLKVGLNNVLQDGVHLGFRERSGIDLPGEIPPTYPPSTEYYNRVYGPRGWTSAVTLNLAIGQGENDQTLANIMQFYAALANKGGAAPVPSLVAKTSGAIRSLGLSDTSLAGLRTALLSVVERGTAAGSRIVDLKIAGKTGTAQNPHGLDHGWFIGFAPVDSPKVVVGAIVEFAEHGSTVARMVTRIIARHLLGAGEAAHEYQLVVPQDSAPSPVPIVPDTVPPIIPNALRGSR
ncbi:MAG: penicillin-binding protein 2 [Gemmatimonadetes bacterium]|nr:penicillin-binding protein 2 [Gemmatimonadota bacterium]